MSALAAVREDVVASSDWDSVFARAPKLAATMTAYLRALSGRLAPRSVDAAERCLRQFALHVASPIRCAGRYATSRRRTS